ncbi:anhydro-N-acetylmuramic acid kinase [Thiomonas bhubaneswarensis]|uniref:Anhydro-N-acetylmuramic acid kinase n=1 Tax=Thiomonas bhubaneswarensis TaxID=339866 RepID=A0A0K6HSS9_9BURK|nr:anhydro-N-acetylmuramic acid kinase [Thiomonas bhubaneswarensis]CUA93980.1 1,6-Anhydro-N-acetylmuramate kinase [Thiomonas bhubaneswarensis]
MRCSATPDSFTPSDPASLYIGLMSGTSLDGVDGVLLDSPLAGGTPQVRAHAARPFPEGLRAEFLALNTAGADELHRGALASLQLVELYSAVVADLLQSTGLKASAVRAIGAHGQTVRHRPDLGYTVQLGAPALLAERCGIAVVADFRSRDVAAGGQGAPLVPAFHRAVFAQPGADVAVLNLGGFANLSLLFADGRTLGFDTGPGNALLDHWAQRHIGQAFDEGGAWAAGGVVLPELLRALLADPFFARVAPKSTGRDDFHPAWLERHLARLPEPPAPQDVQATLSALTASSVAQALLRAMPQVAQLVICGGGARNADSLRRLQATLPGVACQTSDALGIPADQVEAAAFAWLARQTLLGLPGNLPAVTGAAGPRILGAIYPA